MTSMNITDNVTVMPAAWGNDVDAVIYEQNGVGKTTVASATTPDIFAVTTGNLIDYTGTATCTGFVAAVSAGSHRVLYCAGAAVFTAGANLLIDQITSGQNLTCSAQDILDVVAITTTQFKIVKRTNLATALNAIGQVTIGDNPTAAAQLRVQESGSFGGLIAEFSRKTVSGSLSIEQDTNISKLNIPTGSTLGINVNNVQKFYVDTTGSYTLTQAVGNNTTAIATTAFCEAGFMKNDVGKTTVASATTPDIFAVTTGNLIDYTGTATCTGFVAAPQAGMFRELYCDGACLFTAGANLLIEGIPSGTTITLAAGALVQVRAITTTQFKMTYSLSGSFSYSNTTDWSVTKNITVTYSVKNGVVTIHTPSLSGTSISSSATITNAAPACIVPASSSSGASPYGMDNSVYVYNVTFRILSNGTIDFLLGAGNWTSSGTKLLISQLQTYALF